jgi:hypothetical protein
MSNYILMVWSKIKTSIMSPLEFYFSSQQRKKGSKLAEILNILQDDPIYKDFQKKFKSLTPPRKLYIDPDTLDIIIESENALDIIGLDKISAEYLNDLYDNYLRRNIEPSLIEFINTSVRDVKDWNSWLNTYFWHESTGYQMFNKIEKDKTEKYKTDLSNEFSMEPHIKWIVTMEQKLYSDSIKVENIAPDIINDVVKISNCKIADIKKITDKSGMILAYVAKIKTLSNMNFIYKWYYFAIDKECLRYILEE